MFFEGDWKPVGADWAFAAAANVSRNSAESIGGVRIGKCLACCIAT
jgi:hypothetical protein